MSDLDNIIKLIDEECNGSSKYHYLCEKYFRLLAEQAKDKEDRDIYIETAELHKVIGDKFK